MLLNVPLLLMNVALVVCDALVLLLVLHCAAAMLLHCVDCVVTFDVT